MAYRATCASIVMLLGNTNDRSLAKVRGALMKQSRLIFDN